VGARPPPRARHRRGVRAPFADARHATSDEAFRGTRFQQLVAALRAAGVPVVAPAGTSFRHNQRRSSQDWRGRPSCARWSVSAHCAGLRMVCIWRTPASACMPTLGGRAGRHCLSRRMHPAERAARRRSWRRVCLRSGPLVRTHRWKRWWRSCCANVAARAKLTHCWSGRRAVSGAGESDVAVGAPSLSRRPPES
jgi:hypothetical protein